MGKGQMEITNVNYNIANLVFPDLVSPQIHKYRTMEIMTE